jgi:Glycosyltransferase
MKKTILHIIQNFGRGGAETAVVGVLKNLTEYNNVVVTLNDVNEFGGELKYDKYYSLNLRSYYFFPFAIKKLRKIIIENNVDIVHSQLYWSTILARFACPPHIPLITSIQASLTDSLEYKKKWIGWLDKFSYNKKKSIILGVSNHTLTDYFNFLKIPKQRSYVLYNFVDIKTFAAAASGIPRSDDNFKLVTVGNLKAQKNQWFLLNAFTKLKGHNISLDIYGDGPLKQDFLKFIHKHDLPVRLMGKIENIEKVLKEYDLFVMPSLYEGFSLSVLEAMAMQMPLLLSDIDSFKEQCDNTAVYFNLKDQNDFITKLNSLVTDKTKLDWLGLAAYERVVNNFTLQHHMARLRTIYAEILSS